MATKKSINFTIEKENLSADIWFDRQVIEKIVLNLINNSIKYAKTGVMLKLQNLKIRKGI
ncbi:hypothetical protein [Pedobacter sp. D749]|uniref:hypothetical protein n=1 Tax=Pedobacter sp. D749 TaxID=2856523 RepID=UPI001C57802B|nr:hypothetical protein [Pedobacter sp. D749]QXU43656.1 hypothetical protein KYH19_08765 [Pedobacter sp. D749]